MKIHIKRISAFFLSLVSILTVSACGGAGEDVVVDKKAAVLEFVSATTSVESSITLEMKAHIGSQGSSGAHTASIGSDITLQMTAEPLAIHAEYYSRVLVDSASSRDDKEYYIVQEENGEMSKYLYVEDDDEWQHTTLTKAEAMAVPAQTGLIYDWNSFLSHLNDDNYTETVEGTICHRLSGDVPATLLQEFFGNNVFGTFMYSTEMLLTDLIPCTLYVDSTTYRPVQVNLIFNNNFIVTDMSIDTAEVVVTYSKWNEIPTIEIPKKVEIVATNPEAEFYSTYYAWNLFLPYVNGEEDVQSPTGSGGLSFTADWSTYQIRIDGGMTKLPIPYSDMEKAGYTMDYNYGSTIVEANQYIENVPVRKGSDTLYCTFFNPDTAPQPINVCSIGAIDLTAGNNVNKGIQIYLPGEVTIGITRDALVSAYGDPNTLVPGFAADTYTWNGENENQGFVAEVSPINNQVIRIFLKNIPVTGGRQ